MDNLKQAPRRGSVIWRKLTGMTHRLYQAIGNSPLGRGLTAYRRADALLHHGRRHTLRDDCRPMSPARLRMVETVREGRLVRTVSYLFSVAAHCPIHFYGQFALFYGFFGAIFHLIGAYARAHAAVSIESLVLFGVIFLLGLPLLASKRSAAQLFVKSKLTRWLFVGLLGLPEEQLNRTAERRYGTSLQSLVPYVAFLFAIIGATLTLWLHPLAVPVAFLLMSAVAMIFAFPEAGVVLSVTTLPLAWWNHWTLWLSAFIILLTWIGYGFKLLFMHRTIRFNLLDVTVLIFGVSMCLAGMTGGYVTVAGILEGILRLILLSLYFLITNLLTDRKQLSRCLWGLLLTLGLTIASCLVAELPSDLLAWLDGSQGGNFIKGLFDTVYTALSEVSRPTHACIFLLAIPFLCALLAERTRPLHRICLLALIALSFFCLVGYGSVGALLTAVVSVIFFFLLYSHRSLATVILALPALICGGVWTYTTLHDGLETAVREMVTAQLHRDSLWSGAWRAVCENPAGIGLGDTAFASVYPLYAEAGAAAVSGVSSLYMTVLLRMGIPGLFLLLITIFFVLQKAFTALRMCNKRKDMAYLTGGLVSLISLLSYGFISDDPAALPVFFAAFGVLGLCSAYENIVFDEWDTMSVSMVQSEQRADLILTSEKM